MRHSANGVKRKTTAATETRKRAWPRLVLRSVRSRTLNSFSVALQPLSSTSELLTDHGRQPLPNLSRTVLAARSAALGFPAFEV